MIQLIYMWARGQWTRYQWGRNIILMCVSVLLFATVASATAQPVDVTADKIDISDSMSLYRDATHKLGIAEVADSSIFTPVNRRGLNRGFDSSSYWLHVKLNNPNQATAERWLQVGSPRLNSVKLYQKVAGGWQPFEAGCRVPYTQKPIKANVAVFPLLLKAGESKDVYIQVQSETAIDLESTLWAPASFRQASGDKQLLLVLMMGGILLTVVLSLISFFLQKETPYFWFSLLLGSSAMVEGIRSGLVQQYLWPTTLPFYMPLLLISAAMALTGIGMFTSSSLELGKRLPRGKIVLLVQLAAMTVTASVGLLNYGLGVRMLSALSVILFFYLIAISIHAWRQGVQMARYLVSAFLIFWAAESARQLANLGILPWPVATNFSLTASLLLTTPILLIALIERSRELDRELIKSRLSSQAKSDFLARVSHELRSPLNTIIGYARMLGRHSPRLSIEEGSAGIEKSGLRLLSLVDELLDDSRLEAGKLLLDPRPVLFESWLNELQREAEIETQLYGNSFIYKNNGPLPTAVMMDGIRLRQILDNLLSNANRHTEKGEICLICGAEPAENQMRLHFSMSDTGVGILVEDHERIFKPFVQTSTATANDGGRRTGFGIGLSIAQELVHLMGGSITLSSQPGKGSNFSFSILVPLTDPKNIHQQASELLRAPRFLFVEHGRNVLLVEDESEAALVLTEQLDQAHYATHLVSNAIEAKQQLRNKPDHWHLVITDQTMKNGDGWSVLHTARSICPAVPVILLSAMPPRPPSDLPAGMKFDVILKKPVMPEALLKTIHQLTGDSNKSFSHDDLPLALPEQDALEVLMLLMRGGEFSAIEEWVEQTKNSNPACLDFAEQVHHYVSRLDFTSLEKFINLAMTKADMAKTS